MYKSATAVNSGYYRVFVDGVQVSQHNSDREANERACNEKEANPDMEVYYDHDYKVVIENMSAFTSAIARPGRGSPQQSGTVIVPSYGNPPYGVTAAAVYNYDSATETTAPNDVARVRWNTGTESWDILGAGSGEPFTKAARTTDSWDGSNCVRWTYLNATSQEYNAGHYYEVHPLQLQNMYSIRWIFRIGSAFHPPANETYKSWFASVYPVAGPFPDRDHSVTPTGYDESCCVTPGPQQRCPSFATNPGGSGGGALPDGTGCGNPIDLITEADTWICAELLHDMGTAQYLSLWNRSGTIDLPSYPGSVGYISIADALSSATSHYLSHFRIWPVVNNTEAMTATLYSDANAYWDIDSISFAQVTSQNISDGVYLQGPPSGFVTG